MRHRTIRPDARSLAFTQVNTEKWASTGSTKQIVTDPRRDALVIRVRLRSLDGGRYQLFALHDPALANGGMDDTGRTVDRRAGRLRRQRGHRAGVEAASLGGCPTGSSARTTAGPT